MSDDATSSDPYPSVDRAEAEAWALSLITAAHYGLDEYVGLSQAPPPGGVAALASVACASIQEAADAKGVSADGLLKSFCTLLSATNSFEG